MLFKKKSLFYFVFDTNSLVLWKKAHIYTGTNGFTDITADEKSLNNLRRLSSWVLVVKPKGSCPFRGLSHLGALPFRDTYPFRGLTILGYMNLRGLFMVILRAVFLFRAFPLVGAVALFRNFAFSEAFSYRELELLGTCPYLKGSCPFY